MVGGERGEGEESKGEGICYVPRSVCLQSHQQSDERSKVELERYAKISLHRILLGI